MHQDLDVAVLNMTPVFSQVKRDSVGTTLLCQGSRNRRVGLIGSTGLSHGGDMVNVDAKFDHR